MRNVLLVHCQVTLKQVWLLSSEEFYDSFDTIFFFMEIYNNLLYC